MDLSEVATARSLIDAFLESVDVPLDLFPIERLPAFSPLYCYPVCHKTCTPLTPLSVAVPCSRQPIPGITQSLCFLSNPAHLSHLAGCLLSSQVRAHREKRMGYFVPYVHFA